MFIVTHESERLPAVALDRSGSAAESLFRVQFSTNVFSCSNWSPITLRKTCLSEYPLDGTALVKWMCFPSKRTSEILRSSPSLTSRALTRHMSPSNETENSTRSSVRCHVPVNCFLMTSVLMPPNCGSAAAVRVSQGCAHSSSGIEVSEHVPCAWGSPPVHFGCSFQSQ